MQPMKCTYYRDTGFRDGQSWEPGTLLQFVGLSHGGIVGIILPDVGGDLVRADLKDIRSVERIAA